MTIAELFSDVSTGLPSSLRRSVMSGIACNSKLVSEGFVFIAIKGTKEDGSVYVNEAIARGAKVIVREQSRKTLRVDNGILFIGVSDARAKVSELAARFFGYPSRAMNVVGITGTNGKTTVSFLLHGVMREAGFKSGIIGTVHHRYNDAIIPSSNTTPDAIVLQSLLSRMVKHKVRYCMMEVSSHSLDQQRVADVDFSSAIFTNLTQDHLDYHRTLECYFCAKQKLFKQLSSRASAIINADDAYARRLIRETKAKVFTYGLRAKADITARDIRLGAHGSSFFAVAPKGDIRIATPLVGLHNIYNILAVVGTCFAQGIAIETMTRAIARSTGAPGRLEPVECEQPFKVFVDYAHTDDALKNVLSALRQISKQRLIVVFGCGGDRDTTKRPKMGRVASTLADYVIVTSDNPRSEDPRAIAKQIIRGISGKNYRVILERESAISEAFRRARKDDIVLIAGKGHETQQIYRDRAVPFDDRVIARKLLRCLR